VVLQVLENEYLLVFNSQQSGRLMLSHSSKD
jgi:hypothetical protein